MVSLLHRATINNQNLGPV